MSGSALSHGSLILSKRVIITLNQAKLCDLIMIIPIARNNMEKAFENQKCIEVSLEHVYNGSLVLQIDEKSLSKTATFSMSAI